MSDTEKFRELLTAKVQRIDRQMSADTDSAAAFLKGRAAHHEEKIDRVGHEFKKRLQSKIEQPRAAPAQATSLIKSLGLFGVCTFGVLAAMAVGAGWAFLHYGFDSPWVLAILIVFVVLIGFSGANKSMGLVVPNLAHLRRSVNTAMMRLSRCTLGVACLAAGGALLVRYGAATLFALLQTHDGLSLENLFAITGELGMIGASVDLFRGRRPPDAKEGTVAHSKFATRRNIDAFRIETDRTKPDSKDQGIYLGTAPGGEFADAELRYKETKHLLCFGTPGANKSMGLVVPNLAHLRRSMIVIDPKGQLAAITARKRALMGRVIVLNPFNVLVDQLPHLQSDGWNPLLQLDPRSLDFEEGAGCIADAAIEKSGEAGNNKFFDNSAENLFAAMAMWERYSKGEGASLGNIRAELSKPTIYDKKTKQPASGFLHTLKLMAACNDVPAIAEAGGRLYSRLTDKTSQATAPQDVIDTVLANTKFMGNPHIKTDMANGGAIDFAALHREVTTIYLILPPHLLVAQAKWLRLFVNLSLAELYKNPPTADAKLPAVLYLLDEFGNLGRLSQILNALNISRDYSFRLFMFVQNLGQLKTSYPKEYTSFFTGAGALCTFATGDNETAEELSKRFGDREEIVPTQTVNGVSMTPHAVRLIKPEDISRLGRGETITLIQPCPWPVRGLAPVFKQTPFADGLDDNPYYRG